MVYFLIFLTALCVNSEVSAQLPNLDNYKNDISPTFGYANVRKNAHMFWWLYRTTAIENDKPLIIWLQGGPGVSGTAYGNFEEIGPLDVNLQKRNHTLIKNYNVLFIDNPVGTGFSYVENDAYCEDNRCNALDIMVCIKKFLRKYPEFTQTPTYVIGEAFGGVFTVILANLWYNEQRFYNLNSNFKGIALISSAISPAEIRKSRPSRLFQGGLIDPKSLKKLENVTNKFVNHISSGNVVRGMFSVNEADELFVQSVPSVNYYKIDDKVDPFWTITVYSEKLREIMDEVKNYLNLSSEWGDQELESRDVFMNKGPSLIQPVVYEVERLVTQTNIKVFVLNGQFDAIVPTLGTLNWIETLTWREKLCWASANRTQLVINNIVEGFSKGCGNLKFYSVYRAGHMIPIDNPVAMEHILQDLISDQ